MLQITRIGLLLAAGMIAFFVLGIGFAPAQNKDKDQDQVQDQSAEPAAYSVKGVVKKINPEEQTVVIKHEEIPDYMPAMTMPFEVKTTDELDGLQPGDNVTFQLKVTESHGWIEQIQKTGQTEPIERTERPMLRPVPDVEVLEVGDRLANYQFTNELGKAVSLKDFRGQALGITFIYTRCPYPNFCPQMSRMFAETQEKLKSDESAPGNWQLLSITLDPNYDTPRTLKSYAEEYDYDPVKWTFLRGSLYDVDALTQQFNMATAWSPQEQNLTHQLRTAVVDPQGRVQKILKYNQWTVEEFVEEILRAARSTENPQEPPEPGSSR
jgi:protein SCO1/2